jgi:hypothetical protein
MVLFLLPKIANVLPARKKKHKAIYNVVTRRVWSNPCMEVNNTAALKFG